jgi:hypothetical protein
VVAYQLGNIYLLLAMVGVAVLYTTTEAKVVHNYVIGKHRDHSKLDIA